MTRSKDGEDWTLDELRSAITALQDEVCKLRVEADARHVLGRYMYLCDVPDPMGPRTSEERGQAIAALFTGDGIWEGVGQAHGTAFGRQIGPQAIASGMARFFAASAPRQIFNTHYLCTEQLRATAEGAEGHWVQFQPWIDDQGQALLRSSRLNVRFRHTDAGLKIAHYRTENLFIANLPADWTDSLISQSVLGSFD